MAATPRTGRGALRALPLLAVPVVFITAAPSLKTALGGPTTAWVGAAVAIFVMGYAWYSSICLSRGQDEVQRAQTAFAARWGGAAGQFAFMLLLVLPPFRDFFVGLITESVARPAAALALAMTFGACGVILLQGVGTVVASVIWWKSHQ